MPRSTAPRGIGNMREASGLGHGRFDNAGNRRQQSATDQAVRAIAEIAERMGCPIGTVRSRIFRAREAIDARLRPLLDGASLRSGH